jgi:protein phosphatase
MLRVAEAVQRTDTGRQREANEDAYFSRAPVFAVADGMGGARAGEIAARIAVQAFAQAGADAGGPEPPEAYLRETAQRANSEIFEFARGDSTRSGMGTTLTAAMLAGNEVSIGHVGDSRAYLYRDGELSQLTNDHSLVEELRRQGKLTRDQAAEHPQRSVITRALGPEPRVAVDTMTVQGRPGDVFLLCSDGLTTMLSDEELSAALERTADLKVVARRLVRAANNHGGRDNITVVLFRLEGTLDAEGEPTPEGATLIGAAAEEAGLTAGTVREASAAQPPMRRPAAPGGRAPGGRSIGRWALGALALLALLAVLAGGAFYGARQVWFLGSDEAGRVALFRGLPYDLPLGVDLYSEVYSAPVLIEALPEDRQDSATNHELRSRDDAVSLVEDLQRAAAEQALADRAKANRGGKGDRSGPGGGQGSGGGG